MKLFGPSVWGPALRKRYMQTRVPAGADCDLCSRLIDASDYGAVLSVNDGPMAEVAVHRHCLLIALGLDAVPTKRPPR